MLANILSGPLLGTDTATWLSLFGFFTGWLYLRFFRVADIGASESEAATSGRMRGDASETFAFVSFFPDVVYPFLAPICDGIFDVMVKVGVLKPFADDVVERATESAAARSEGGLPSLMNGSGEGGGARRAEAERRRALALKALDERLNAAAASRSAPQPVAPANTPGGAGYAAGGADEERNEAQA